MIAGVFAGCAKEDSPGGSNPGGAAARANADTSADNVINVWSFTEEIPNMLRRYTELNPDFPYTLNFTVIATTDGSYQPALDLALQNGGSDTPHIYAAEAAFVVKYTSGSASSFAATFAELGIDVSKVDTARIATYAKEIGTRGGAVVGLPYQATGGAYIYRRSIAKEVFGTDDPAEIKNIIGPGWDKFMSAAAELKANGYAIVSGVGDVWHPMKAGAKDGWVVNDKLVLDPARENLLDIGKQLYDNNYMNNTEDWQEGWFADMIDQGPQPVFGYFGPAWFVNYVMNGHVDDYTFGDWAICEPTVGFSWGGTWVLGNGNANSDKKNDIGKLIEWITLDTTDDGLQYKWANGNLFEGSAMFPEDAQKFADGDFTKDTVASAVVMDRSNGEVSVLGGQNMFDIFIPAGANATGANMTEYDEQIQAIWRDQVNLYIAGEKDRDAAIADFKQLVEDELGFGS